ISVAVGILSFIMIFIIPKFEKIFKEFEMTLPEPTQWLMATSNWFVQNWYMIPLFPVIFLLFIKLVRLHRKGAFVVDWIKLQIPIMGGIIEKTIVARTMRTLGTLISSGVPILEALSIVRETCTNIVFENCYIRIYERSEEHTSELQSLAYLVCRL